jgi:hypothetical protein
LTRWEYKWLKIDGPDDTLTDWDLKHAGEDGWEAVGVVPMKAKHQDFMGRIDSTGYSDFALLMKRPRELD